MNIQGYGEQITEIKKPYDKPISGIIKYKLEEYNISGDSFFKGINNITIENIKYEKDKLDNVLVILKQKKHEIKNDNNLTQVEKNFLLNTIEKMCFKILSFKYAIYLEAEKLGFELTDKQRNFYIKKVNLLQDYIYGKQISDTPNEVIQIKKHLRKILQNNKSKITKNEFEIFTSKLNINKIIDNQINTEINNVEILNKTFSKDTVKKLFDLLINIYGLDGWSAKIDNYQNFRVDRETKQIILPEDKIEKTNLKRLLQLFDHEVGVHAIRQYNTDLGLKISGDGYNDFEEGLATLSEKLFDEKLEKISIEPTVHHITTYIGENFNGNECIELFKIYFKLTLPENTSDEYIYTESYTKMLRVKRFYSFNNKGANRKDVSYTRGQFDIIEYLKTENDIEGFIKKFYFAKLSKDDINLSEGFSESLKINENKLKYPLWIGKIIYKKLLGEQNFVSNLQEEDIRFQAIDNLNGEVKRKIIDIIKIIKE